MFKLLFTNARGQNIELFGAPFHLYKVEGIGDVESEIQVQKAPYQDGSTFIDALLSERHLSIELIIRATNKEQLSARRQFFSSVFNPKLGEGTLRYINGNITREILAIPEGVPFYPDGPNNRTSTFQKTVLNLFCANPYWLSEEMISQLVVWEGGLTFPLKLPTKFARQSESKAKILLNEGDVETPVQIVFNGPATSPIKVINVTTGEYIEVNQSLLEGERLEINTAFGQKRVTKVLFDGTRINAFHFITLGSSFFHLTYGNNLIDYSTGADYERAGVEIIWQNRYIGV